VSETDIERLERIQRSLVTQVQALKALNEGQRELNSTMRTIEAWMREVTETMRANTSLLGQVAERVLAETGGGDSLGELLTALVAADRHHAAMLQAVLDAVAVRA